jgi:type IV secretory pathway TraG/TraD family ATPase VirD4
LLLGVAVFACSLSAQAQVPQEVIDRVVALEIEAAHLRVLEDSRQITRQEKFQRAMEIRDEVRELTRPYRRLPQAEREALDSRIKGLVASRTAVLMPTWQAQGQAAEQQAKEQRQSLRQSLEADVQRALDLQRERLRLVQGQASGSISSDEYSAKDAQAANEIAALREKYAAAGRNWANDFDAGLERLTKALGGNPDTELYLPTVVLEAPGAAPDFEADVRRAADLRLKQKENARLWKSREISPDTHGVTEIALRGDINALRDRHPNRYDEFNAAVKAVLNPPPLPQAAPATASPPGDVRETRRGGWNTSALSSLLLIAVVIAAIYGLIALMTGKKKDKWNGPALSDNHGSADWAPLKLELSDPLEGTRGVFLGKSVVPVSKGDPDQDYLAAAPIFTTPERHTLIVAPQRTGKGTRVIIPTLLRYLGSMLVIDPKGENAAVTARVRRDALRTPGVAIEAAGAVHIINPWSELADHFAARGFAPARYNPLDIINRHDPNAVAIAQSLAAAICPLGNGGKETFWQGNAGNLLAGVFLWLANQPTETKTLGRAREIITLPRGRLEKEFLIPMTASEAFGGAIREFVGTFIDLAPETFSGILANLAEATKFLSDPQIKAATESSTFSMDDLLSQRTTVYLVVPPDRLDTQRTWLRLVIAAAMHTYKRQWKTMVNPHRCMFLIDEFPALGRLDDIPRDIATMGGQGVDFTLVVQGIDQIKAHYGDASSATILNNCAYKWFCNLSDLSSAKYLSEMLGKKTVRTVGTSTSPDGDGGERTNTNYGEMGRPLLTPDELLTLGRDGAIVLVPEARPHIAAQVEYWRLKEAFAPLKERYPQLFWNPPLAFDENPYVPRERRRAG